MTGYDRALDASTDGTDHRIDRHHLNDVPTITLAVIDFIDSIAKFEPNSCFESLRVIFYFQNTTGVRFAKKIIITYLTIIVIRIIQMPIKVIF